MQLLVNVFAESNAISTFARGEFEQDFVSLLNGLGRASGLRARCCSRFIGNTCERRKDAFRRGGGCSRQRLGQALNFIRKLTAGARQVGSPTQRNDTRVAERTKHAVGKGR